MDNLIQRAKEKDPDAFTELIQYYMQSMYKVAKAILHSDEDVADAIQETILRCWERLDQLRENRYFKTWMTRILINECNGMLKKSRDCLPEDMLYGVASPDPEFYNVEWNETLRLLDEKYRLVILLYYVEGFKASEIGRMLGIPESTVRTRLARGREKMAVIYQTEGGRATS